MPYYADLNPAGRLDPVWATDEAARKRAIANLLRLRRALDPTRPAAELQEAGVPPARDLRSLLLGTWNIRELDSATWGARLPETYAYIAEIIDRFDLVAVQEVRSDLEALERLCRRLGRHWSYIVSDTTAGKAGNEERLAFLYDTRKVRFLGMAGELVLPPLKRGRKTIPARQVARTPLMAAFQVGWTKFVLTTVHILYGEKTAEPIARIDEIRQVAEFLKERSEDPAEPIHNFIVLGDFNIFAEGDKTMKALTEAGDFTIPEQMKTIRGANLTGERKYDQIAYRSREGRFEATGAAGVFDYYEHVFTPGEADVYRPYIDDYIAERRRAGKKSPKKPTTEKAKLSQYKTWRTYQMSDHLPLWAEFRIDFSDQYLAEIAKAKRPR
jgi:endonuclease/exonuclease/phosphatase family metal-dependent hydrolase